MGHAHHFLSRLERLNDVRHINDAKLLYYHSDLLQMVLEQADLPANCERVAISLADPVEGPWIITTGTGEFVTCLASGMRPRPTQPRILPHVLKAAMAANAQVHEYVEAFARYVPRSGGPRDEALMGWVHKRPDRVAFEDAKALVGLSILAPYRMTERFREVQLQAFLSYEEYLSARKARYRERHQLASYDLQNALAHIFACLNAPYGTNPDNPAARLPVDFVVAQATLFAVQSMPVAVRGLWSLRHGPDLSKSCTSATPEIAGDPESPVRVAVGMTSLLADERLSVRERISRMEALLDLGSPGFRADDLAEAARLAILRPADSIRRGVDAGRTLYGSLLERFDSEDPLRILEPFEISEKTALATLYSVRSSGSPFTTDHLPLLVATMPHFLRAPLSNLYLPAKVLDALQGR
jgi:hypothetical protein